MPIMFLRESVVNRRDPQGGSAKENPKNYTMTNGIFAPSISPTTAVLDDLVGNKRIVARHAPSITRREQEVND